MKSRRLTEIGVDPDMTPGRAKHIRFVNAAAFVAATASLVFIYYEAQLIVDWGVWDARDWSLLAMRIVVVAPFLAPVYLNAKNHHRLARLALVGWAFLFCLFLAGLYGRVAPTPLFFLLLAMMAVAVFPENERGWLAASLGLTAIGLIIALWLRQADLALVPVSRQVVRDRIDVYVTVGSLIIALMIALAQRVSVHQAENRLAEEQARSERLLLNILPAPIAARLKDDPGAIADGFDDVTVLFADIVGFTPLARRLAPHELVAMLDEVFRKFDALTDRYGLEKIKTIGDAYMVAGGLPAPVDNHTEAMALMALEMMPEAAAIRTPEGDRLGLRVGLARGPAVAGVIGERKFSYDLWGDTVNTASRLESHGDAGRIQVNEAAYAILKDKFVLEARGEIDLKGQGPMKTWYLNARK